LLFDWPNKTREWFEGFLLDLELTGQGVSSNNLVPYERGDSGMGVRPMAESRSVDFLGGIEESNRSIEDPGFVEKA
jgi:hypothetical protein